ncbi:hypothetical protein GOODEAATRI_023170 [Goodea atripinnis]|uniref:Uncharacterized protein n=1 Tax=Goodea atripinnis TaxID=208336 RepID=A0ABV0P756_9TELE
MGERQGTPWTGRNTQTTMHTLIHTPKGNLELPVNLTGMSLDCGRKPEYLVRTHVCTERTCKLHAERPPAGSRTQDLLAARQQCYPKFKVTLETKTFKHTLKHIFIKPTFLY